MRKLTSQGFSAIETLLVLAVVGVLSAMAVPTARNSLKAFHLSAAVSGVSGALQSTRYQAIMMGCPYQISFGQDPATYQVQNEPLSGSPPTCASTYSNVGAALPWSTTGDVTLATATTLQISANGSVTVVSGSLPLVLSNGFSTERISISGVGNVSVSP